MLIPFFFRLRDCGIPVTVQEFLTLMEAIDRGVIGPGADPQRPFSLDDFYYLSRAMLVKDESRYDRFDQAFGAYFRGVQAAIEQTPELPLEWLIRRLDRELTPEEKAKVQTLGGWDALMKRLKALLEEQKARHEGGNKWIGTGGTSPFGAGGYNPEGIRIGQEESRHRRAVKVWDQRAYRDYDDRVELGTRNIKIALRRLRRFARQGADLELDLDTTIAATARNAGWLDLKMVPERHNAVKVLMLLDVGGTMDDHVERTAELFSAARTEFKHLEFYYFHNCVYDYVWKNNHRRQSERTPTADLLHKYTADYKLIFVGDATMSPYEILQPGGSVEFNNAEAGQVWLRRLLDTFPKAVWLNPEPERLWQYRQSIDLIYRIMGSRMYAFTIEGLERAMRQLSK